VTSAGGTANAAQSANANWAELRDVALVLTVKALITAYVLRAGFTAISDDDFSRVVIAQDFAHAPRLDPSGTSWLPLPFWITGSAMAVFGRTLGVARAVAVLQGLASAVLVHRAGRWVGIGRVGALLAAIIASAVVTSALLGASFQPEALTSGLVVLGAAAATRLDGSRPILGATALAAACLCRYEAWPAGAAFAAFCAWHRRPGAAALAVAAPIAWIVHGGLTHGDALFFAHRVGAYRSALGIHESTWEALIGYPRLLAVHEPALLLTVLTLAPSFFAATREADGTPPEFLRALVRPAVVLASILAFLIVGRVLGDAPTHHAERALLAPYFGLSLLIGAAAENVVRLQRSWGRAPLLSLLLVAFHVGNWLPRDARAYRLRTLEMSMGAAARSALSSNARLAIDTPDYGYFAVIAAFGATERCVPLARRDPRTPDLLNPFVDLDALRTRLVTEHATALVVSEEHWPLASSVGRLVATREQHGAGRFALYALEPAL
jgi:hypothetical protein